MVSSEHKVANALRNKQLPFHFTSLPSSHHVTPCTQLFHFFDPFTVHFPSNTGGSFLPLRIMSAWASPELFLVHAAYRAGSRLRAEMSRDWELVSTNAQSGAPASGRRSKGVLEQLGSAHDALKSAAEKTAGVGNTWPQPAIPVAGCRSKGEWEQFGPTLVVPGNVAVKTESSGKAPGQARPR